MFHNFLPFFVLQWLGAITTIKAIEKLRYTSTHRSCFNKTRCHLLTTALKVKHFICSIHQLSSRGGEPFVFFGTSKVNYACHAHCCSFVALAITRLPILFWLSALCADNHLLWCLDCGTRNSPNIPMLLQEDPPTQHEIGLLSKTWTSSLKESPRQDSKKVESGGDTLVHATTRRVHIQTKFLGHLRSAKNLWIALCPTPWATRSQLRCGALWSNLETKSSCGDAHCVLY